MDIPTLMTAQLISDIKRRDWRALSGRWGLTPKHIDLLHSTPAHRWPAILEKAVQVKVDAQRLRLLLQSEQEKIRRQQLLDDLLHAGAPNQLLREFGDDRYLAMRATAIGAKRSVGRPRGLDTHKVDRDVLDQLIDHLQLEQWLELHRQTGIQIRDLLQIQREVRDGKF